MEIWFVAAAALAGAAFGAVRALRRGGIVADAVQWGLGHGIAALLLAVIAGWLLGLAGIGG